MTRNLIAARRWRAALVVLALIVPAGLFSLFLRQERRLYALADHGAVTIARVTRITRQGATEYAEYAYQVNGVEYTWSVTRTDAPHEPGEPFSVTYLPEVPSLSRPIVPYDRARLEAELNLPVRRGMPLGAFVFLGGFALHCHREVRRLEQGGTLQRRLRVSPETAGRVLAGLLLAVLLTTELDPEVREVQAALLGTAPLGLPVAVVSGAIVAVLFAPYFWVMPHLLWLVMGAQAEGRGFSKFGIVIAILNAPTEHRRSRAIVLGGLAYFVVLVAIWIAITASRGL